MKRLIGLLLIIAMTLLLVTSCTTPSTPDDESGVENGDKNGNETGNETGGEEDTPPATHTHEYNRKKPASAFVKTSATCTESGVYYYSCSCGASGTESFTDTALSPCKYENGSCKWCKTAEPTATTDGLVYSLTNAGAAYTVSKYNGTAADIYIPAYHEGKPVVRISANAFRECTSLTSVILGENVVDIESNAFADCTNLERIVIGTNVKSIGDYAFGWCKKLNSINLPDSLTTIENNAFWMCSALTELRIPYSVTKIGKEAISRCDGLTSIYIPDSVTSIVNKAFYWNPKLEAINVDPDNKNYASVDGVLYDKNITAILQYPIGNKNADFKIPDSVKTIGYFSFSCSENLKNLTIPNSISKLEYNAFDEAVGLKYNNKDGLSYLGNENSPYLILVKAESKSITAATVESECKFIADYAFSFCTSLTTVSFGANSKLISIGNNAFFYCDKLESVTIPASTTVLNSPFYACTSLKSVTLENTSNWYVTENHDTYVNPVGGVAVTPTNSATNVTYFLETYSDQCWYKK